MSSFAYSEKDAAALAPLAQYANGALADLQLPSNWSLAKTFDFDLFGGARVRRTRHVAVDRAVGRGSGDGSDLAEPDRDSEYSRA